jgi:hypothetical protein
MLAFNSKFVIPAKAGTQPRKKNWVPAFAGMTSEGMRK